VTSHAAAAALRVAAACLALGVAACATLPDTEFLDERYVRQSARFESAHGPLDARRSAAVVAGLKRKSGDLDILDRQVVLEQEIGGSALVVGNRVTLLQDGPETYRAMLAAIAAARDHVNLESYDFEDGEVGQRFAEALLERQASGVQVNIIYDSVGTFGADPAFFERLRRSGVRVVEFNPVNPLAPGKSWAPNNRDHRKLLIVDGRTAFLGGVNISSVYASGSGLRRHARADGDAGWRDTDVRVEGTVVADYQRLFISTWEKQRIQPDLPHADRRHHDGRKARADRQRVLRAGPAAHARAPGGGGARRGRAHHPAGQLRFGNGISRRAIALLGAPRRRRAHL
jgi:cardiolipin synthase